MIAPQKVVRNKKQLRSQMMTLQASVSPFQQTTRSRNQDQVDSFGVELDTEPTADVTVTITDNDSSEILVSPTTLVFSSGNYSTAQTVNLTAVEDNVTDAINL